MIDFDTQYLPDELTLPLLWAGLLVSLHAASFPPVTLRDAVIGAVAGYLSLWSVYWLFKLLTRQGRHGLRRLQAARRTRRLAGLEDAAADCCPLLVGRRHHRHRPDGVQKRDQDLPLAFGPYLAIAGAAALFIGPRLSSFICPDDASKRRGVMAFIVGLTGGIGSGKSLAAKMFGELQVDVVDTDVLAHEVTARGTPALSAIAAALGDDMLLGSGDLDRAAVRRRVFADPAARAALEHILHPRIAAAATARIAHWKGPYGILVVPLLLERGGLRSSVDRIAVVDCSEAEQVRRVMARSGLSAAEVAAIMAAQVDRATRLAAAR